MLGKEIPGTTNLLFHGERETKLLRCFRMVDEVCFQLNHPDCECLVLQIQKKPSIVFTEEAMLGSILVLLSANITGAREERYLGKK